MLKESPSLNEGGSGTKNGAGRDRAGQGGPTIPNVKIDDLSNPLKLSEKCCSSTFLTVAMIPSNWR